MQPPIASKDLVAQVETEILSAGSWRTPVLRGIRKTVSRRIISLDRQLIIETALALISRNQVHRFVPYELVQNHPAAMAGITWSEVERLGDGMASWDEVDCFGCSISGPAWAAGQISDVKIKAWARSPDRWRRRAALVSTLALNGRPLAQNSTERTLEICRLLIADREDMVVKAMSWALRRLGTKVPDAARNFVNQHKERLAPLIVREVNRKLTTGRKDGWA